MALNQESEEGRSGPGGGEGSPVCPLPLKEVAAAPCPNDQGSWDPAETGGTG